MRGVGQPVAHVESATQANSGGAGGSAAAWGWVLRAVGGAVRSARAAARCGGTGEGGRTSTMSMSIVRLKRPITQHMTSASVRDHLPQKASCKRM